MELRTALLLALLLASAVTDLLDRKIFNALTYPAVLAGLLLSAVAGFWPLAGGLAAIALTIAVFYPLCRSGGMGLGDLKLMAAVGALAGLEVWASSMVASALAGGVFALATTLRRGTTLATLRRAVQVPAVLGRALRRKGRARFARAGAGEAIPYGAAIAVGTCAELWWRWPWG